MTFYTSIAKYYDYIFPLNPVMVSFIKDSFGETADKTLLDMGCGTGNLCMALAPHFGAVKGADPDGSMLAMAREKAGKNFRNLQYIQAGMLETGSISCQACHGILCMGNTLVHLSSAGEVLSFLEQAYRLLEAGGRLLIQIIHYDNIIGKKHGGLSTIENEKIRFIRNYYYHAHTNTLDFETILTIKRNGHVIRNVVPLLPLRREELLRLLSGAGYSNISMFGDFKRNPLTDDSIQLVVEAVA
jgi:glycine/sarcosine N-methyltransferase